MKLKELLNLRTRTDDTAHSLNTLVSLLKSKSYNVLVAEQGNPKSMADQLHKLKAKNIKLLALES